MNGQESASSAYHYSSQGKSRGEAEALKKMFEKTRLTKKKRILDIQ